MKQLATSGLLIAILLAVLHVPVFAQTSPMTEAHIEKIRSNCVEAQSTLTQLHASDALLRVNRGQVYESISTKLMTPFNSRAALGKIDSTRLVSLTATYEQQLTSFRNDYKTYEEAMAKTLRINCQNQPVAFYDSVTETREKRKKVHEDNLALQKTIQEYRTAFTIYKQEFLEDKQ